MKNYYFLAASFPPLSLNEEPEISFEELSQLLKMNLTPADLQQAEVMRRFIDIQNIRAFLMEETIDPRGNLDEKELDEALLIKNILPSYVFDFLDEFRETDERLSHFSALVARFFVEELPKSKGFLRQFLIFERQWRLVMLAWRAKYLGRDIGRELQFEDPTDPFVAEILVQKDAERYEPPPEFQQLRERLMSCGSDPLEENRVFAQWRFEKLDELAHDALFSLDRILAYVAQLMIVEYLRELDAERGRIVLDTFISG